MDAETVDFINGWYLHTRKIKPLNNVLICNKLSGL